MVINISCFVSVIPAGGVMVWGIFSWHTLVPLIPTEQREMCIPNQLASGWYRLLDVARGKRLQRGYFPENLAMFSPVGHRLLAWKTLTYRQILAIYTPSCSKTSIQTSNDCGNLLANKASQCFWCNTIYLFVTKFIPVTTSSNHLPAVHGIQTFL